MKNLQTSIQSILKNPPRKKKHLIYDSISVILLIGCIVFMILYMNMHGKYSELQNYMHEQAFSSLSNMISAFDSRTSDDVQQITIPQMRGEFASAVIFSDLISDRFGMVILTEETIAAFRDAFDEYDTALRNNTTIGLAEADMEICINSIRSIVQQHYLPKTTTPPPVDIVYRK